ncbi:HTH_Tnp_Tc3_2 domain-containing protein [Trichonephila clavipes]|nr:HTH_Tnp_Tc3_2 domain-containing protein [Trichonephila clavipes]
MGVAKWPWSQIPGRRCRVAGGSKSSATEDPSRRGAVEVQSHSFGMVWKFGSGSGISISIISVRRYGLVCELQDQPVEGNLEELRHIGLYARRPVRCVPLTATRCRPGLTCSRENALWTPPHWSCVMFSDESRFSLQSDSRRTLIWRAPGTRYHQENTIERHRYGGAGWLV